MTGLDMLLVLAAGVVGALLVIALLKRRPTL